MVSKTKNKTLNDYQSLSNSVKNKKNKKSYTPSYNKKSETGYILFMIPIFVFVFLMTIFIEHQLSANTKVEYSVPSSTKVMTNEEMEDIVAEILKQQNDEYEIEEDSFSLVSKEIFEVPLGTYASNELIGQVARAQLGNKGGQPFWSYWGFKQRVAWCAIFASWCADQLGYIEKGIVPYFASVGAGTSWFIQNNLWAKGNIVPSPGMYIFFDSDDPNGWGPQDGKADHVGLVEKVEDGYVYCIEGNYKDAVHETKYPVGYYQILGYGTPKY